MAKITFEIDGNERVMNDIRHFLEDEGFGRGEKKVLMVFEDVDEGRAMFLLSKAIVEGLRPSPVSSKEAPKDSPLRVAKPVASKPTE